MKASEGLPQTPPQRPPMARGLREAFIALAALPVLLIAGIYVGGQLSDGGSTSLEPAAIGTAQAMTPGPVATVVAPVPTPVVTVKPPAPSPVVTVRPRRPSPPPITAPSGPVVSAPPLGTVAPVAAPALPRAVLGRGSSGPDVRTWQVQMSRRGWQIRPDGVFGPQTERVARRFQHNKGLRVDGLVGPQTWAGAWRLRVVR